MPAPPSSARAPPRVLTLCSGNSVRSQMVEGWFRRLAPRGVQAFSAGIHPAGSVHPLAIRVMGEVGVDLADARPKPAEESLGQPFDYVITVCAAAERECPAFPGRAVRLHWPLDDPGEAPGDEDERRKAFRRVRDKARAMVESFLREMDVHS